jgi:hypothetical protein
LPVFLNASVCLQDNVQADGVKESEVQAAAAPAAAEAKPQAAGAISASVVKELREKSGAGMMACKKALSEAAGDFDKVPQLRLPTCSCLVLWQVPYAQSRVACIPDMAAHSDARSAGLLHLGIRCFQRASD